MSDVEYKPVESVWDYYDQPRAGVAMYSGIPHYFERLFDEAADEFCDVYALLPLSPAVFDLAAEAWEAWVVFRCTMGRAESVQSQPDVLVKWREARSVLKQALRQHVSNQSPPAIFAKADFRLLPGGTPGALGPWEVRWREVPVPHGACIA